MIAHDIYDKDEMDALGNYLDWVRDKSYFSENIAFDIDDCGMELSIK